MEAGNNKILLPLLVTAPLVALVWMIAVQSPPPSSTQASERQPPARSIYRTTAVKLYHDYNADAAATQLRIGQSQILVTGTVMDVSKDYLGQSLVQLDAGNGIGTAVMTLAVDQSLRAMQLRRGKAIAVSCEQMQRYSDAPTGTNCTLVEPYVASDAPLPRGRSAAAAPLGLTAGRDSQVGR